MDVICTWLTATDDLNLRALAQIESHTATKYEAPEFTDLGHKSFLHLATHNSTILKVLDSSSLKLSLQSENRQSSNQVNRIAKDHVFDFLQQCDLTRNKVRYVIYLPLYPDGTTDQPMACVGRSMSSSM